MKAAFFIKLMEIPELGEKLLDPKFNQRLSEDPASVLREYGISVPQELIPDHVELPSPERIAEVRQAFASLASGDMGEERWFPFIIHHPPPPPDPWFYGWPSWPWFPFFSGTDDGEGQPS